MRGWPLQPSFPSGTDGVGCCGNVGERYFLFELGGDLGNAVIEFTRKLGVECCAESKDFHFVQAKRDPWQGPREDFERLHASGVNCSQIDSKYESFLL